MKISFLEKERQKLASWNYPRLSGRVTHVIGLLIESQGPEVFIGEICAIYGKKGKALPCQVVGFKDEKVMLMALGDLGLISPGAEVFPTGEVHQVAVTKALCGRVLDALGRPIDGKGEIAAESYYPVWSPPPSPLSREPIQMPLTTGIKTIDGLLTLAKGQRMGIFSPAGVGKSAMIGRIARRSSSDVNVIALIGERGREVREFIEKELGHEGLEKSVVVVATSDEAALLRSKGANVATAIAEYFRDLGKDVLLIMDSISRYALALREIGLAIGEPPTTKGYTPSVFAEMPKLLERAGNSAKGSITGLYTVLTEEGLLPDPIADSIRSLLDGHIVLSKNLAENGHFPPIDVLKSLSRVMGQVIEDAQMKNALFFRKRLSFYEQALELMHLGAYTKGSDLNMDEAVEKWQKMEDFLKQDRASSFSFEETIKILEATL